MNRRTLHLTFRTLLGPVVAILVVGLYQAGALPSSYTFDLALVAIYGSLTLSVSLLAGWSGVWSVGHPALFAIGAYVASYGSGEGWPLEVVAIVAAGIAAVCGLVLGLAGSRFSILYIALLTLAFTQVMAELISRLTPITGGDQGRAVVVMTTLVGGLEVGSAAGGFQFAILGFGALLGVGAFMKSTALRMRMVAAKSHAAAARSIGISPEWQTALSFAVSGSVAAVAGVMLAANTGFVSPESFGLNVAIIVIAGAVLGGVGTIGGAVIGGLFMSFVPRYAGSLPVSLPIVQGAVLIIMLLFLPKGLLPAIGDGLRILRRRFLPVAAKVAVFTGPTSDELVTPPERAAPPPLVVRGLGVRYGGVTAIADVDLTVAPGEILGVIGPNGAGKTTLLNALSGLTAGGRVTGSLHLGGADLRKLRATGRRGIGLARTFQHGELFSELTVAENVLCARRRAGRWERRRAEAALSRLGALDLADKMPGQLAFGQQKRVDFTRAVHEGPALVLLDEPFGGLDESERQLQRVAIEDLRTAGISVLLIDHVLDDLLAISDRVVAFDFGTPIASGLPGEIMTISSVRASYLGIVDDEVAEHRTAAREGGEPAVSLSDLSHHYAGVAALRGITLDIPTGRILAVAGSNGAGKSTLGRILGGQLRATDGFVTRAQSVHTVGLVPEGRALFTSLTIRENLEVAAYGCGLKGSAMNRRILEVLEWLPEQLRSRTSALAGGLSGGEQQLLAIARAIVPRPQLLILDEPALGLAPVMIDDVYSRIAGLVDEGMTVVLLEQLLKRAMSVADDVAVIRAGRIVASGAATDPTFAERAETEYFGVSDLVPTDQSADGQERTSARTAISE